MTDKVQKIREEVARIQAYTQSDVLKEILDYIDKVQEEPKFKTGDHIKPIDSSLGAPRTILKVCDGWYVTNQGTLDFEFEDNWELAEEPVSEDLEKIVEEIAEPTILNAYGTKELARRLRNTICSTSVSDELEKAANEIVNKAIPPLAVKYKDGTYVGRIRDCFDRKEFIDLVKAGAQWQKQKDNNNANHALVEQIKTQQMYYEKGMADMKQQMMANAVDVEVKVDAGGYPYIPQIELYDYEKDIPLAKEGDKYKVVLIKEE